MNSLATSSSHETDEMLELNAVSFDQPYISSLIFVNAVVPHSNDRRKTISDGGATRHCLNSADGFGELQPTEKPLITAAGQRLPILGIGDTKLHTSVDQMVQLKDAVVCTHLTANYISEMRLEKDGYEIRSKGGIRKFYLNDVLMMVAEENELGLYEVLIGSIQYARCHSLLSPKNIDQIKKWHVSLSHVNLDDLRHIRERLDIDIPSDQKLECIVCIKGKAVRIPFTKVHRLSKHPLDIIHTDLSGIIRIPNRQNYKYFLLLIDDHSRFTFIYLLRSKDEVSSTFARFKTMIELQVGRQIRKLKSDGGTEFDNQHFRSISNKTGMVQIFSTPRCPQQNGTPERMNRTIETMARCMLIDSAFSTSFWPYAVQYAVYIKNRLPHSAIKGEIPFEQFYKSKVNFKEIKPFGCRLLYLKDDQPITKFDPKAEDGLFLGFPPNYSAFYVYTMCDRKVIIRRHVYFATHPDNQIKKPIESTNPDENGMFNYDEAVTEIWRFRSNSDNDNEPMPNQIPPTPIGPLNPNADRQSADNPESPADQTAELPSLQSGEPVGNISPTNDEQQLTELQTNQQPDRIPARPARGERIQLKNSEKDNLLKCYPDLGLIFCRPVRLPKEQQTELEKGAGIYRVNAVIVPRSYKQISRMEKDEQLWQAAVDAELAAMEKNKVWIEVDRPKGKQILPTTYTFKIKYNSDGTIDKRKARLCVLGNLQRSTGEEDTYAPVMIDINFNNIMSFAVKRGMHAHHVDVFTAFLHSPITEEVYIEFPAGMIAKKGRCLMLKKSIYGLRSSALSWYNTIKKILIDLGFRKLKADRCIFFKRSPRDLLAIIGMHVDDFTMLCDDADWLQQIKVDINKKVTIADRGVISQFLGMDIQVFARTGHIQHFSTSIHRQDSGDIRHD